MGKNIVYPYVTFNQFIDEPILKKIALFFDHIYVDNGRFSIISDIGSSKLREEHESLLYEKATWDFLIDNNVVKPYKYLHNKFDKTESNEEVAELTKQLTELYSPFIKNKETENSKKENLEKVKQNSLYTFFQSHDISVRLDAIQLRKDNSSEFYPALRTNQTFQGRVKKSEVIQFLLNDIPEPDFNTPWEKILEFRADEDIRNKYLALTNWVNKVAASPTSLSDVKDEYEYLYSEYIKYFKLHKMKYNNTLLEVIVNARAGVLMALQSGEFITSFKNLFQLNLSHVKLLEEEGKLPGKEVAYIYHAKQRFS